MDLARSSPHPSRPRQARAAFYSPIQTVTPLSFAGFRLFCRDRQGTRGSAGSWHRVQVPLCGPWLDHGSRSGKFTDGLDATRSGGRRSRGHAGAYHCTVVRTNCGDCVTLEAASMVPGLPTSVVGSSTRCLAGVFHAPEIPNVPACFVRFSSDVCAFVVRTTIQQSSVQPRAQGTFQPLRLCFFVRVIHDHKRTFRQFLRDFGPPEPVFGGISILGVPYSMRIARPCSIWADFR